MQAHPEHQHAARAYCFIDHCRILNTGLGNWNIPSHNSNLLPLGLQRHSCFDTPTMCCTAHTCPALSPPPHTPKAACCGASSSLPKLVGSASLLLSANAAMDVKLHLPHSLRGLATRRRHRGTSSVCASTRCTAPTESTCCQFAVKSLALLRPKSVERDRP